MTSGSTRRDPEIAHAQRERFRFIESSLLWEGRLQRQRVSSAFGISLNHVTKVFRDYDQAYPDNLVYDQRRQSYTTGRRFKPHFASRDPGEYLALQLAYAESGSAVAAPALGAQVMPAVTVPSPPLGIPEAVLQQVVRAIARGEGIDVLYHSSTAAAPGRREIWPHSLVHTGIRWHVRAYDGKRKEFRNFALQRIDDPKPRAVTSPVEVKSDGDWMHFATVKVVPNPKLNAHQQQLVARDFGMSKATDGPAWVVKLRQCLVGYFVVKYGLDPDRAAAKRRIVLADPDSLRAWLLPNDNE